MVRKWRGEEVMWFERHLNTEDVFALVALEELLCLQQLHHSSPSHCGCMWWHGIMTQIMNGTKEIVLYKFEINK